MNAATTPTIHSVRLGRTDDYAVMYRGADVGLMSWCRIAGAWYAYDADLNRHYTTSRRVAEHRVVLTHKIKATRAADRARVTL